MNDIRQTIDLLEDTEKGKLEQVKLKYGHGALSPVMSSSEIDYHYGKLYKGYVDRYNKGEGDKNFNEAGAYLHGIFFSQFKSPGVSRPHGTILDIINRHHHSFVDFKKNFKAEAMKVQGSGWVYLSKSGQIKTIKNHAKRTDIAFLLDMWEHAYNIQYGSKKDKYIDSIWRIVDWSAVNHRL
jgi:Fe-Mn family superoxide dismutase